MSRNPSIRLATVALVGALALGAAACEDDPTGPDEDHAEPVSVRLMLGGQQIASAAHVGVGTVTGGIELSPGEETDHITVQFLDEDGDGITFDQDYSLEVEVGDESIAEFEQDTPGEFGGHAHGVAAGSTTMTFILNHGNHADFTSAAIPVEVVEG